MAPAGVELICIPTFIDVIIDGAVRTAIRLMVEPRHKHEGPIPDIREPQPMREEPLLN
jgi:stage V sporulation protein S